MIDGTKEAVKINFPRFRDAEGLPTCALSVVDEEQACCFLRTRRFGTEEVCALETSGARRTRTLLRRDGGEWGSLIPGDCCVLFNMKNGEESD